LFHPGVAVHELSIALGILDVAEEEAERHDGRVAAVHLRIGPLSGVVREALASAFDLAREGTTLAEAELVVQEVAVVAYCPACEAEVTPSTTWELRCPVCDGPTPVIVRGDELEVVGLEIAP
jgi:hydrogenase nickel incorporation protein HypA/HybF